LTRIKLDAKQEYSERDIGTLILSKWRINIFIINLGLFFVIDKFDWSIFSSETLLLKNILIAAILSLILGVSYQYP